jgi:hypothetical protein
LTSGRSFQEALEDMDKRDRTKTIPEDYIMVTRVCILLRGLGMLLKLPPVSIAEAWRPFCEQCLENEFEDLEVGDLKVEANVEDDMKESNK